MIVYKGFIAYYLGFGRWRVMTMHGGGYLIGNFGNIAVLIKVIDEATKE